MRRSLAFLVLALLCLGGAFAAGLYIAWMVRPVQPVGQAPAALSNDAKETYIRLVADTYAVDGDLRAARERLAELRAGNPRQWAVDLAQREAHAGHPDAARRLARLAFALDAEGPVVRELAALVTPTSPATVTAIPSPTVTPTPLPPESEQGRFDWVVAERRRLSCAERTGDGLLLVVRVEDADGAPLAGIPLRVESDEETERFFTGLRPDDPGYADFEMTESRYVLAVDDGRSEPALDLTTDDLSAQCTGVSSQETTNGGWFVRFQQTTP